MQQYRIKDSDLEDVVDRLNKFFGFPERPWVDGKAQIGNLHITGAYGKVKLVQMIDEGGSITNMTDFASKRELLGYLENMFKGAALERRNRQMNEN